MKQLIFTFFLVILCYSLFFDKKAEILPVVDEIDYVQKEVISPKFYRGIPDTMNYFALNSPPNWIFKEKYNILSVKIMP